MRNGIPGFKFYRSPEDGASSGATTDANSANVETASTNDILATLKHDPFPGGESPADKGTKNTPAKTGGKAGDSKGTPAAGADGKTADGADGQPAKNTPAADPEKDALRQSLTHATDLLEAYKSRQTGDTGGAAKPAGKASVSPTATESDEPSYDFNIPDQLVTALTSDDPAMFKQGVAGFAKGIGMGIHKQVTTYIEKQMPTMLEKLVPAMIQNQMQTFNSRKAIFDDFYGTYKELNNPKLYPIIGQITSDVQKELKTTEWNANVRDTVATRVKEFIQSLGGTVSKVPAKAPAAKHPVLGGGNNTRGGVDTTDKLEQDIADTLFGGF